MPAPLKPKTIRAMNIESKAAFKVAIDLFKAIAPIRLCADRMDMSAGELEWHVQEVVRLEKVAWAFLKVQFSEDLFSLLEAASWEADEVSRECKKQLDAGWHNIDRLWREYLEDLEEPDHPD